ncbi:DUF4416 family protein [Stieleria sp. TO1_6]|nr:DUF4416 family protein [Stieleria tagensis]
MAEVLYVEPVIRFCAVISQDDQVRRRAIEKLESEWGKLVFQSAPLPFLAGGFYTPAMGAGLRKELLAFEQPLSPDGLADWKLWTNAVEAEFPSTDDSIKRPLNLDPGYITQAKLVLATTKDRDHRIYLRNGIFGEITLTYSAKKWNHHRWTYPDYRTDKVCEFVMQCRNHLRERLLAGDGFRNRKSTG